MKNAIRLALLCMTASTTPALAQNAIPQCGYSNLDSSRDLYTVKNPAAGAVNQQCLLTVYPSGAVPQEARRHPGSYIVEGTYLIELSGGGGGGGGGASEDKGGGGGGAGAAPSRTAEYLAPGTYKMTIGTGGAGGGADSGSTESGNPTSLTRVNTGQLIAGFEGADGWRQRTQAATDGRGGVAAAGGSSGGAGGDSGPRSEEVAQSGGMSQTSGYAGVPGASGSESGRSGDRAGQSNAGGGGGASVGSGGAGESVGRGSIAGTGELGGGGGGGRGGANSAQAGGEGGHGFIRLSMSQPAPQAVAPVAAPVQPVVVATVPVSQKFSLSADMLFGFGKTTLRPEGKATLDDVVSKLGAVDVSSITDTGHADRIGPPSLNQKLSMSRAEAVKAYLVSKGVDARLISASGMGEQQPLTARDDCKGAATPKVIACLQPDRRVDVEVTGTNKVVGMN